MKLHVAAQLRIGKSFNFHVGVEPPIRIRLDTTDFDELLSEWFLLDSLPPKFEIVGDIPDDLAERAASIFVETIVAKRDLHPSWTTVENKRKTQNLNARQQDMAALLRNGKTLTSRLCTALYSVTRDTTNRDFRMLVELGIAAKRGKGRSCRYVRKMPGQAKD